MRAVQLLVVTILAIGIGTAIVASFQNTSQVEHMLYNPAVPFSNNSQLPSLDGATQWLNSPPLTPAELRGKVVLVNFWTYTCINWLRQLPYVRAWAEKYKDQGLVVIGVHTPEFAFEHDLENVRREVVGLDVNYPVAVDNDYAVWNAFSNHYWPALYLIDAQGNIRYHQFGEGNYEQSERMIQQLLAGAGNSDISSDLVTVQAQGVEVAADWGSLQSPENYLGYDRTQNFVSLNGEVLGEPQDYTLPEQLFTNEWALSGNWTMEHPFVRLNEANGRIVYRFHARDLHLVMGPATPGTPVRFRVLIDGQEPGAAHGTDVNEQGIGAVTEQRLYQLIRQEPPIAERLFEIEFLDAGVEAYAFTFG
jgi:thiol-disulfide isomerase/thioredoxin